MGKFLAKDFRRVFGPAHHDMAECLGAFARGTIECLASSDALYHNYEHTLQIAMVGREILQGMTLSQRIQLTDYSHLIIACLLHDIGYMRGVLSGDTETEFVRELERQEDCACSWRVRCGPLALSRGPIKAFCL